MSSTSQDRVALWRDLMSDQASSGLSVSDWCAREGVSTNTFYYWRKRISSSASPSSLTSEWLPLPRTDTPHVSTTAVGGAMPNVNGGSTTLTLRVGRVCMEIGVGFDRGLLSDVLNMLEARC